ncbi:MAG: diguanylate cyclase [Xanthobacteraceae bacterium]|nr:diguanylate cyclase [Xanthobacteraceae bacterium]
MSRTSYNRRQMKLKRLFGIRGRLVLLALILVVPLMLERARSLEDARARQIAAISREYTALIGHAIDAQRQVISSVEAVLRSSSYIHGLGVEVGEPCIVMRASFRVDLPWIRSLSVVDRDGRIKCSTLPGVGGLDLSDRTYLKTALAADTLTLSDYVFSRASQQPAIMAAYPLRTPRGAPSGAVIIAAVNLRWMSSVMNDLGGRPGVTAQLIDGNGVVLAAPDDLASTIAHPLADKTLLAAIREHEAGSDAQKGSLTHRPLNGGQRTVSFTRLPGSDARLIVSIDEAAVTAGINREIRVAYFQVAFVCLLVLLGALLVVEGLIMRPIQTLAATAQKLGRGERGVRAARHELPTEFMPLARAFNAMAMQLAARENELLASNNRLSVMATIDTVSGLANRRGFQSRLDFEWLKAEQNETELALLMVDVDCFKLYNDTYGHLEGDACLSRLGETLANIAVRTFGFAARYGGEEFCVVLPGADAARAMEVGEMIRAAVRNLAIPHHAAASRIVTLSVGVAATRPNPTLRAEDLIEAADAALYAAKHAGRDRVVQHGRHLSPAAAARAAMAG